MTKDNKPSEVTFEELVDIEKIRKIFEHFYDVNKLPNAIGDPKGKVLVGCGWQDICTNFHRKQKDTRERCSKSDKYIFGHLSEGKFLEYKCKNGLWDAAYPIIVNSQHLAIIYVGQFFYEGETPDRDFFIQQAREYGFDQEKYLMALDKVPYFTRSFVKKTMDVYVDIATMLSEQGLIKIKLNQEIEKHKKDEASLKRAQKTLNESEEKYRLITENSTDLIGMTTLDEKAVYLYVSPSHEELLGYSSEELVGTSSLDFMHPVDKKILGPVLKKYIMIKKQQSARGEKEILSEKVEYRLPKKSGGWVNMEGVMTIARDILIFVSRDITDRKKMQEVLIESEKLASIGALVAEITHQINNPLQIITGRAQLGLMDEIKDKETEENYRVILEEGMKTKEIVERLLKFSKPSKGETAEVDMNVVIEEIVRLVEPQYELVKVEIIRKFSPSLPGIEVDGRQIQEVLLNLMNNAAQSMSEGGEITISTIEDADNIKIEITDTGKGISEENLKRLFEPFFTTKEKGTGLGLPVCYGIVKAHGGKISFKSKEQEGTTVTVFLPLKA